VSCLQENGLEVNILSHISLSSLMIVIEPVEGDCACEDQLLDVALAAWWESDGVLVSWSADIASTVIESSNGGELGAVWGFDVEFRGQAWVAAVV